MLKDLEAEWLKAKPCTWAWIFWRADEKEKRRKEGLGRRIEEVKRRISKGNSKTTDQRSWYLTQCTVNLCNSLLQDMVTTIEIDCFRRGLSCPMEVRSIDGN